MVKYLILIILISCSKVPAKGPLITGPFEKDGKCLINIGHRLGGDIQGLKDNSLVSAKKVLHLQSERCFRDWEFDINSAHDDLVLFHDTKVNGVKTWDLSARTLKAHTFDKFIDRFTLLDITKDVVLDIKLILTKHHRAFFYNVDRLSRLVPLRFVTSKKRMKINKVITDKLKNDGFEINYY